jgi:hypothetical protein
MDDHTNRQDPSVGFPSPGGEGHEGEPFTKTDLPPGSGDFLHRPFLRLCVGSCKLLPLCYISYAGLFFERLLARPVLHRAACVA